MAEIEAILSIFAKNETGATFTEISNSGNTVANNLKRAFSSININDLRDQLNTLLNETFTVNVNFNAGNTNQNGNPNNEGDNRENRDNDNNTDGNSETERLSQILRTVNAEFTNLNEQIRSLVISLVEMDEEVRGSVIDFASLQFALYSFEQYIRTILNNGTNTGNRNEENENSRSTGGSGDSGGNTDSNGNNNSEEEFKKTSESIGEATENANKYRDTLSKIGSEGEKSMSTLGKSISQVGQSLQGVTSMIGKLVSIIGSSSLLQNFIDQASERQTNQMMLTAKSKEPGSTLDPQEYYTAINQKVIELPGNDQFLNQILTQIAVMEDYSTEEIGDMADIITNYYMLARAKGQTNFETEKEIRNYILTGNTKGLENSVLATEIKMLKEGNNVKERTIQIEKAMQNIHMDGMAHYESYMNSMETFTGHFQKAAADIGSVILAILTPVIRVYNAIDDLAFEGINVGILLVLSTIVGVIGGLTVVGSILIKTGDVIRESAKAWNYLNVELLNNTSINLKNVTSTLLLGSAEERVTLWKTLNTEATEGNTLAKIINTTANYLLGESQIIEAGTVVNGTVVTEKDIMVRGDGIITRTIEAVTRWWHTVAVYDETVAVGINTEATANEVVAKNLNITATIRSIASNLRSAISNRISATSRDIESTSIVGQTIIKVKKIATDMLEAIYVYLLAEAEVVEAGTVVNGTVVTAEDVTIREAGILVKIKEAVTRWWHTVAVYDEAVAVGINTEANANEVVVKNLDIGATLKQIISKLRKIALQVWEITQTLLLAIAEQILIAVKGEEAVANTVLAGSTITLKASIDALKVSLGPIGAIFDAIGLSMYAIMAIIGLVVGGFLLLTNTGGSLDTLTGVFGDIWSGIQRVWDAFANSEPVQQVITTFQNFAYAIEGLFNWLSDIGGFLWELIFGVSEDASSEGFDILGLLLEIGGAIGNFIYWLSPLGEILSIFDAIGSAIDWFLVTWNKFMHSAEMDALITAFQDVRKAFGEVFDELGDAFGELWDAFAEVGDAFMSIFQDDSSIQETTDDTNVLLDVLKGTATFIKDYVVPVIHALVIPFKILAEVIRTVADVIKGVIGFISDPLGSIKGLGNAIVGEFTSIPNRIIGAVVGIPQQVFGGLVDGVLSILGISSPGFIQEAVVGEFLGIPSRILGGIGNLVGAVGSFATAIWSGFDNIFGTDISSTVDEMTSQISEAFYKLSDGDVLGGIGEFADAMWTPFDDLFGTDIGLQVDGFINRLSSSFQKLSNGDIIGAVKDFGDNLLGTLDNIFGQDISGMVNGFFDQINSTVNKVMNGDIVGAFSDIGNYIDESIGRFTGVDIQSFEQASHEQLVSAVSLWNDPTRWSELADTGAMKNPQNLVTGQTLTQTYNNATNHSPTIVNNNFGEGSVQADARNMSAKDVQTLFTGAFGYNKARGTQGVLS